MTLEGGRFKLLLGNDWCAVAAEPSGPFSEGGVPGLDFGRVRDVVDIVVDGTSISGRLEEDSIFFLVRDLLLAVEKLSSKDGVAHVSFYEAPWELVLQRIDTGSGVYITFYRGGRVPEVVVKDLWLSLAELRSGIVASARELEQQALALEPTAKEDSLVAEIAAVASRIEKQHSGPPLDTKPEKLPAQAVTSSRWKHPRNETGFSFGFDFQAKATDLLAPEKAVGRDLSALLFPGVFAVHYRQKRYLLPPGYLFLQTERLLATVRQLLTAWEESRPMSTRLISEGLVVGVRLDRAGELKVSFADGSREDTVVVMNDLTPWEYADAVLGVARELRRNIVEVSPGQRRNLRLVAFSREIRSLSKWTKEQQREAVINVHVERYRKSAEPRQAEEQPIQINGASRIGFRECWRLEVEGLDLGGTMLCGGVSLVSSRGALIGVSTATGAMVWRRDSDRGDGKLLPADTDGVIRCSPRGQIEFIELSTGVKRWRTRLAPRSGGAPVLLVAEHGMAPGVVVTAEEDHRLIGLDVRTGEPRWNYSAARGGRFSLRRYGRLLYLTAGDNQVHALDLECGSLVWRFNERSRFFVPPAISGDVMLLPGGRPGRREGRLFALDAFSGVRNWDVPLHSGAVTTPIIAGDVVLVPSRVGREHELIALHIPTGEELWRRSCTGWAESCALMALDQQFIINSAGGVVRSIDAPTGEERWITALGPTCSEDVPLGLRVVLRGGVLFVPADTVYVVRPEDGHVVHCFGGEPPVPDLLQVDPQCSVFVAEESGHISFFEMSKRLSVITGGIYSVGS